MSSLELTNVSFAYTGNKYIIKNLSLTVASGERVAILGHNGCGKSTLLQVASGNLLPSKGTITLDGQPLKKPILHCSQDSKLDLFLDMSILENALLWENCRSIEVFQGVKSNYAKELTVYLRSIHPSLQRISLLTSKLSGGERQLLLLALLMRRSPNMFLLDEYASALDPSFQTIVAKKLAHFSDKYQIPTLMVTHKISDIRYTTRFIALKSGQIFIDRPSDQPPTPEEVSEIYDAQ